MVGGPPISFPAPSFVAAPRPAAPPAPAPRPAAPAAPRPVVRAQSADDDVPPRPVRPEPRPVTLALRPPEQLGIGALPTTADLDWNDVHRRLARLGSLSTQMQRLTEGGYRFICVLPTSQPDRTRRVEALGSSEGEAVRNALAQAER